ncbi:MAG: hypothetical protein ACTHKR_07625 [Sphingomonas sp.]
MSIVTTYYSYLQRKADEAGRFGSLNEMRGQALPWMGAALLAVLIGGYVLPGGSIAADVLFSLAGILWFGGLGLVCWAFIGVSLKRKKLDAQSEQDNG